MRLPRACIAALEQIVGPDAVQTTEPALWVNAYDCSLSRTRPDVVVHLSDAQQVPAVVRVLNGYHIPFVVRASATNHAGSCAALRGGAILNISGLNRILQINTQQGFAVVEPGVITGQLQRELAPLGFFYAPDPASESVSTIGGNLAQNASGARCMKYGATLDHVLAADVVLPDGSYLPLSRKDNGPDWIGLFAGSEGTLGVFTRLTVRILPVPKHIHTFLATFPSLAACVQTVSDLTARGIVPRCAEAMDQPTTQAIEAFAHAGYPVSAAALLLLELDGTPMQIKKDTRLLEEICKQNNVLSFVTAKTPQARAALWRGRRSAYAAMARLAPNVMVGDGTVPRSRLPHALQRVRALLNDQHISASLLFHAGDGNFHPHVTFDERHRLSAQRMGKLVKQILQICVEEGGTISGEHGVGVEKRGSMALQYDTATLKTMAAVKQALDPQHLANPLKILPDHYAEKARPACALRPEVAALQAALLAAQEPLYITGNNSRLKTQSRAVLSTRSLNQIYEIDLTNYTATVGAGVLLCALQQALHKQGVYAALPAGNGTVGGAFASGCCPWFYSHVLGIEVLLADGSCIRYGGKFTKNAAGYPLTRLFAGSHGSFGVITELTFKLFATPCKLPQPRVYEEPQDGLLWQRLKNELDPTGRFKSLPEQKQ